MYGLRCMFLAVAWFALQAFAPGTYKSGTVKPVWVGFLISLAYLHVHPVGAHRTCS